MACIHEATCKYRLGPEEMPVIPGQELAPIEPETKKKSRGKEAVRYLSSSDKDIRKAKKILTQRRLRGLLTPEQIQALKGSSKTRVKNMSGAQREQILSILKDTAEKE